jgi:hypothetical protein
MWATLKIVNLIAGQFEVLLTNCVNNGYIDARFEVPTVMKIQAIVFWDENGGNMVIQNVGILPHHYMVSQSRRP